MKYFLHLTVIIFALCVHSAAAQSVIFNPTDPVTYITADNQAPAQPAYGKAGKWIAKKRMGWNATNFKPYIYKGVAFRVRYPKTYNPSAADGKKYPVFLFFHGLGEAGSIYDNEYQLYHGGQTFDNRVNSGAYDGFLIYPQSVGYWGASHYDAMAEVIKILADSCKADLNRITVNGLSAGGTATWEFAIRYPQMSAGIFPMSGVATTHVNNINELKYSSIWLFQGGKDGSPSEYTANYIYTQYKNAGANFKYTMYPDLGHGTWNRAWSESDFTPAMGRVNVLTPWPLNGRSEFCPGETFNITIGIAPGFDGYEWSRNDVPISGATSNSVAVNSLGIYKVRVKRGTVWSEWSPTPLEIKTKAPTQTPAITIDANVTNVIPAPNGQTGVELKLPAGYESYKWQRSGDPTVLGTNQTYNATSAGDYIAYVTEEFGCASNPSPVFKVIAAAGQDVPDAISGLSYVADSKTQITLNWLDKPNPANNETQFEVYRGSKAGGPYALIAKVAANTVTYTNNGLTPNLDYFYVIRPVNANGAGPVSAELKAEPQADKAAPGAPQNLRVRTTTRTSATLGWNAATEDVAVAYYDIYVNGEKEFTVNGNTLSLEVTGLTQNQVYNFIVKARDASGNRSAPSNQVTAAAVYSRFNYKYYTGTFSTLPNFDNLTPAQSGFTDTVSLNVYPSRASDNFAYLWEGYINIPVDGTYTFYISSDDGSMLFLGSSYDYNKSPFINNDGLHGNSEKNATVQLKAGIYPIAATFFERGGDEIMNLRWKCPQLGINSPIGIRKTYFVSDNFTMPGSAPNAPGSVNATKDSYKQITITWNDNNSIETGYQIYRSTSSNGTYTTIGTVGKNVSTFADTSCAANTRYYYKLKATGQYGESGFSGNDDAITDVLPSIPAVPASPAATAVSSDKVQITFTDNTTLETGFEIQRSVGNTSNFKLLATLPAQSGGTITVNDSALFANQLYYYRIRSKNDRGNSSYTANVSATTLNTAPAFEAIPDQSARYGATTQIPVIATDADGDPVTLSGSSLPAFVNLVQNAGAAYLEVAPSAAQAGTYTVTVTAADNHSGVSNESFELTINDNYSPVINAVADQNLNEGVQQILNLGLSDANAGDTFTWTAIEMPAFVTLESLNTTGKLTIKPGYADAGLYTVRIKVADNNGGIDTRNFTITVADKEPNYKIFARFKYNTDAPAPWNNMSSVNNYNLKNDAGETTPVSIRLGTTSWFNWWEGPNTGNNSGVYPDVVMREYYFFGSYPGIFTGPSEVPIKFGGLDVNKVYSIKIYAGSVWGVQANNGTTIFTHDGVSKSLAVQNNRTNTADFENLTADSNGEITITASRAAGTQVGYIGAFEITAMVNDGTNPADPRNLSATFESGNAKLQWTDVAYNETGYEVYRSPDSLGTYTLLNTVTSAANAQYTDATILGGNTYYYKVRAVTSTTQSGYSNIARLAVPNKLPVIANIDNVGLKALTSANISISATDDPGDLLTITQTGLPASFGTFSDNGDGTASIALNPTADHLGSYDVTIKVADNKGGVSQQTFNIVVSDKNTMSTYFNFTNTNNIGAPWNNITAFPVQGTGLSNAKNETGANSGISLTFNTTWTSGTSAVGVVTGGNTGIYPDNVISTGMVEYNGSTKTITISGLNNAKLYNFVFFNSLAYGADATTTFTINGSSVTLNGAYNSEKTVQLNGITPSSGSVTITATKPVAARAAFLNALVIEEYDNSIAVLNPVNLRALTPASNKVDLTWADRAYNETGYEVYRALGTSGSYSLLATLAANTTSYTDNTAAAGTQYAYKVRAKLNATASDYSNNAVVNTPAQTIFLNFTETLSAGAPWNNANARPIEGPIFTKALDDKGFGSSVGVAITVNGFAGIYGAGVNTGNNSGIYPDNVMRESYGMFAGASASMKITGLNPTLTYSLTFFNSSYEVVDCSTLFTVNGEYKAMLNASQNRSGTATLYGLVPNDLGEISIDVAPGTAGSVFGLLNAIVIQSYALPHDYAENNDNSVPLLMRNAGPGPISQIAADQIKEDAIVTTAYPNPFTDLLNVDVQVGKNTGSLLLEIFDLNGRMVYRDIRNGVAPGKSTFRINTANVIRVKGFYLLRVTFGGTNKQIIRLIKQ